MHQNFLRDSMKMLSACGSAVAAIHCSPHRNILSPWTVPVVKMPPIPSWSPVYILYHCLRPAADCVGELHCNCWHASWNPDDAVLSGAQYLEKTFVNVQMSPKQRGNAMHLVLMVNVLPCKRGICRTRSPRYPLGPGTPAWRSSLGVRGASC